MVLTERDRKAVAAVWKYRYLTFAHIQALVYPGIDRRTGQDRMRRMWSHHIFDRHYFKIVTDGTLDSIRGWKTPLYMLAKRGACVIWDDFPDTDMDKIPKTPTQNAVGFATLRHHLVAIDHLVSVEVAIRDRDDITLTSLMPETKLRKCVAPRAPGDQPCHQFIVSDGAFTLQEKDGQPLSFHLEVVRAEVRGGNNTLERKMRKYVALNRAGFFKQAYGHDRVRAVLIATTTQARAENFRQLAARLPGGRQLFWFTAYEKKKSAGPPITHFTPDNILNPIWTDVDGNHHSLVSALTSSSRDEKSISTHV